MPTLFDSSRRTDPSPAQHAESLYHFLNRVESEYFGNARDVLESWYAAFPDDDGHLLTRFRSRDDRSNLAAFWELYIHALYRGHGFEIEVHPQLTSVSRTTPDFMVHGSVEFVVEARLLMTPAEVYSVGARTHQVYDAVNQINSPNFFVGASVFSTGATMPSLAKLKRLLETWLASLDPDAVTRDYAVGGSWGSLPSTTWEDRGWSVQFQAIPKKVESRSRPGVRPLGFSGPGEAVAIDDHTPLVKTLKSKAPSRYGQFNSPYVIAVLSNSLTFDATDVFSALFGSEAVEFRRAADGTTSTRPVRNRDGFWYGPIGVQNTRVSGVIIAHRLVPWTIAKNTPRLWLNPYTGVSLPEPDHQPWATAIPDHEQGVMRYSEPVRPLNEILHLPPNWPGQEDLEAT